MYLYSVPKVEGMDLDEILSANIHLREHEAEQSNVYEKIKGHIKHFEEKELDRSWRSLLTEVAYWRKANQVHNWFVMNVQNGVDECGSYEVTKENLQELCNICLSVLSKRTAPVKVLPTKSGCYFGSTSYDEFYYYEIDRTKSILGNLLKTFNFDTHYLIYTNSW